jgi:hypothetical protein
MIAMLTPSEVAAQWPELRPMLDAACRANEIADNDLKANDLYIYTQTDKAFVLAMHDEEGLGLVLVIQPTMVGGRKCADILAMAGRRLLHFKALYWDMIKDWLRANEFQLMDSYASERLARIYSKKFGFTKSAVVIRQEL